MFIGYDGEASGGVDSTTATGSLGRGERSLGKTVRIQKRQVHVDVIQAVVNIATNARKGTGKRKGFCALISINIRNAFNTASWNICIEALMRKKVPDYLLRMIDDYLSDRWVIYEGNKWSRKEEMTCGVPQGSRVGPLVWNVMYDDFLRMDLPAGRSIVGFANDALVVCTADDVRILELRINESLWRAKPNGRASADGSPGRTDDGRVVRDFKLEPTAREV